MVVPLPAVRKEVNRTARAVLRHRQWRVAVALLVLQHQRPAPQVTKLASHNNTTVVVAVALPRVVAKRLGPPVR